MRGLVSRTHFMRKSPLACQQTEVDICNMGLSCALPLHDLELNFILGDFNRIPSDEDMDRLTQLKFNPFDTNFRISNCPNYEIYIFLKILVV
jgi:hypothetical protein